MVVKKQINEFVFNLYMTEIIIGVLLRYIIHGTFNIDTTLSFDYFIAKTAKQNKIRKPFCSN